MLLKSFKVKRDRGEKGMTCTRAVSLDTLLGTLLLGAHDECHMMCLIKSQQATAAGTSAFLSLSRRDGQTRTLLGNSN